MASKLARPVIMLVTDRSVIAPAENDVDALERLLDLIEIWANAGVSVVQIREANLSDALVVDLVRRATDRVKGTGARVLVNGRPDIALAAAADGVHLKDDASSSFRIRSLGPKNWIVGQSVHDIEGAEHASATGNIDYLVVGNIFKTDSHHGSHSLGLREFERIVNAVSVPVIAIGGVRFSHVSVVAEAGGAGVAGIRLFCERSDCSALERVDHVRAVYENLMGENRIG